MQPAYKTDPKSARAIIRALQEPPQRKKDGIVIALLTGALLAAAANSLVVAVDQLNRSAESNLRTWAMVRQAQHYRTAAIAAVAEAHAAQDQTRRSIDAANDMATTCSQIILRGRR